MEKESVKRNSLRRVGMQAGIDQMAAFCSERKERHLTTILKLPLHLLTKNPARWPSFINPLGSDVTFSCFSMI